MSRHRPGSGYGHRVQYIGWECWRLSWMWDRYYRDSRLRFPQVITRETDEAGAMRFAEKWGLAKPMGEREEIIE